MMVQAVFNANAPPGQNFPCGWMTSVLGHGPAGPGPLKVYLNEFTLCQIRKSLIEQHGSHFTWSKIVRAGSTAMHHLVTIVLVAGLHVQLDREPSAYSTRTSSFWQAAVARATIGFLLSVLSWPPGVQLILLHYHTAGA